MKRITQIKTSQKILIISAIGVLAVAAVFLSTQTGDGQGVLNKALEGGELALTAVSRNHESLTQFVQDDEAEARQLLEASRVALSEAKSKLNSARSTDDEYVLGMLNNYERVANASNVMSQGVDNLLLVNANITNAMNYYSGKDFENASEQASYCLQILEPLLGDFNASDSALEGINVIFVPSGQRDRVANGVNQHENEMEVYNQIVLFLRTIKEGKDYLKLNAQLEERIKQFQSAIANKDYETAEDLLQEISEILQSLQDSRYQDAANLASKLNPNSLEGAASTTLQELQNRLRNTEGLDDFENYRQSLQKYLESLELYQRGQLTEAEQAIDQGLTILWQGKGNDPELQGMYEGLRDAFNTLRQRINGQPDQG